MLAIARASYSMPPHHGAGIVRAVLEDGALRHEWALELNQMRTRLNHIRSELVAFGRVGEFDLSGLRAQRGMFFQLPLDPAQVQQLRERHAVYTPGSGRISLAVLRASDIQPFLDALSDLSCR